MLKQEVMNMVEQLSAVQLQKVSDYISRLFPRKEKETETAFDDEQKQLLDLLLSMHLRILLSVPQVLF